MAKYVQYGDKRFDVDSSMTLEQIKAVMARHFPELASPKIDTKKDGEDTVYTFTKQAGRKGARLTNLQKAARRLARIKPAVIVPDVVVRMVEGMPVDQAEALTALQLENLACDLEKEAARVAEVVGLLVDVPAAMRPSGSVL